MAQLFLYVVTSIFEEYIFSVLKLNLVFCTQSKTIVPEECK